MGGVKERYCVVEHPLGSVSVFTKFPEKFMQQFQGNFLKRCKL